MRYLLASLFLAFNLLAAPPPQSVDLDLSQTTRNFSIKWAEGTTPLIRANLRNAGAAYSATGWTGTLYLQSTWDDTQVQAIESTATGATYLDFQLTAAQTATSGVFFANFIATDGTATVEWQRGQVEVRASPGTAGASTVDLTTPLNWGDFTYSNTAASGPYRAGTNIVLAASTGGAVSVNSKVVGTAAAGRVLYGDSDGLWKALAAGTSGQVLQSNGAAAPSWAAAGGVSDGDKGDITVSGSGGTWTIDAGSVTASKIVDIGASKIIGRHAGTSGSFQEIGLSTGLEFSSSNLRLANTAVTAGSYGPVTLTVDAQGRLTAAATSSSAAIQSALGAVYLPLSGGTVAGETTFDAVAYFNDYLSCNSSAFFSAGITVSAGNLFVDAPGTITGNGSGLTNLDATDLAGDIPAASFGEERIEFRNPDFHLSTSEQVGYAQYTLTSGSPANAITIHCAKSANTAEQDFVWRSCPIVVPRGFVAFKTTGAIDIDWISDDSTNVADIRGIRLVRYVGTTPSTLYEDATTRNVSGANTPTNISINRSAFTATTVNAGDHLVLEITGTIEDSKCYGILHACIHSE